MVILKKELLKKNKRKIPSILSYENHVNKQSLYNTLDVANLPPSRGTRGLNSS